MYHWINQLTTDTLLDQRQAVATDALLDQLLTRHWLSQAINDLIHY